MEKLTIYITPSEWQRSKGNLQQALLSALERDGQARWRIVCPNILVERIEPYRTLVLRRDSLREQQELSDPKAELDGSTLGGTEPFYLTAELHSPLTETSTSRNLTTV